MRLNYRPEFPTQKDMLVDHFGRFELLAQRVAQGAFNVTFIGENDIHITSIGLERELLIRISAFTGIARITRNRMLCELLQEAVEELETKMATENPEGFENYLNLYELLCQEAMDAYD